MDSSKHFPRVLAIQAVVTNGTQILLAIRNKNPDIGKWELIAGYWKPNEKLSDTVTRHLRGKAGIDPKNIKEVVFTGHYYDSIPTYPGRFCIPLVFSVQLNDPTKIGGGENELQWHNLNNLEGLDMAMGNKQTVKDLKLI